MSTAPLAQAAATDPGQDSPETEGSEKDLPLREDIRLLEP